MLADRQYPGPEPGFGYSDDDAFAVGHATCGGEIDVLVQRVEPGAEPHLVAALEAVLAGRSCAVAQVIDGPGELVGRTFHVPDEGAHDGTLGEENEDRAVVEQARALLRAGRAAGSRSAVVGEKPRARGTAPAHGSSPSSYTSTRPAPAC
ncbi:hypothetical protein SVIOM74S_06639 [Streptomyces violarus]